MNEPWNLIDCCGCGNHMIISKPRKCVVCGMTNYPPTEPLWQADMPP